MKTFSLPQCFERSLYKSALRSKCRRKVKWIDQAENHCQICQLILRPCFRLWLTMTAWNSQNSLLIMSLQFALGFLRYDCIFSKERSKSVLLLGSPWNPCRIILHVLLFSWKEKKIKRAIRISLTVVFKTCLYVVNLNSNKQSCNLYILHFFLLFAIFELRASVKTPLTKRSKQKDNLNQILVHTTEILLSTPTSIHVICKGIFPQPLM